MEYNEIAQSNGKHCDKLESFNRKAGHHLEGQKYRAKKAFTYGVGTAALGAITYLGGPEASEILSTDVVELTKGAINNWKSLLTGAGTIYAGAQTVKNAYKWNNHRQRISKIAENARNALPDRTTLQEEINKRDLRKLERIIKD